LANGFGKTSLAEAIEWLFYGTTKRRQQSDTCPHFPFAFSLNHFSGSPILQEPRLNRMNGPI